MRRSVQDEAGLVPVPVTVQSEGIWCLCYAGNAAETQRFVQCEHRKNFGFFDFLFLIADLFSRNSHVHPRVLPAYLYQQ